MLKMNLFVRHRIVRFVLPLAAVGLVTALPDVLGLRPSPATTALIFILVILFSASFLGRNPALLGSLAAMLSFNYFFLPPFGTWHIADATNWVAWIAFILTAVTAGELSSYARRRAHEAERGRIEIERLYSELREAFDQASEAEALRRSEKLKSSLLDAVTHDLRTPLTSIKASVTTLIEDRRESLLDDEGRGEFLEIIDEETDRLNEFIAGIVGIAKIEANALHLRRRLSSVEEIVNNSVGRAAQHLADHEVLIDLGNDIPQVNVDAESMSEVVFSLLDNAAKYSPKGSKIRVSAALRHDHTVVLSVEDQGRGIPAGEREKIFDKFYRTGAEDIHTTASGLGLGLAIARGIIESQGGRIYVTDGRGEYKTRFVIEITAVSEAPES